MLGFSNREQTTVNATPEAIFAIVSDLGAHASLAGSGEVNAGAASMTDRSASARGSRPTRRSG
jgi:hypothetical protein